MIHDTKKVGAVLAALLAVMAIGVSSASAATYTASSYPTTITGESALGNDVLKTEAGNLECKVHYEATLAASSSSLTVKDKLTSCKAFGFLEATVNMGSCDTLYTEPKFIQSTESGKTHDWTATGHIKCTEAAKPITITAATCKVTIGEQALGGHLIITVTTLAHEWDLVETFTGINYTVVEDGFGCPFGGTGAKTGATYTQGKAITWASTNGATNDVG